MAGERLSFSWYCSFCGTVNTSDLSGALHVCNACGATEQTECDLNGYQDIVQYNRNLLPAELFKHHFIGAESPAGVVNDIAIKCPCFAEKKGWSDFTLFDLFWVLGADPQLAWKIPFELLGERAWEAIWPNCDLPAFAVKRFLSSRSSSWLQKLPAEDVHYAIEAYCLQPWSKEDVEARRGFAEYLSKLDEGVLAANLPTLPAELLFDMWLLRPDCPGLPDDVVSRLDPPTAVDYLLDPARSGKVYARYPFEKFTPDDWRRALKGFAGDETGRFKNALWNAWTSIGYSNDELYELLSRNPSVCFALPLAKFSPETFLFLLSNVKVQGWDISAYCPFEKFSADNWIHLLSDARVVRSRKIGEAFKKFGVATLLSTAEIQTILDANPWAAEYFCSQYIPVDKAVELYLNYPDLKLSGGAVFSDSPKELAFKLLVECKERVPACASDLLDLRSKQGFSDEEVEDLIRRNPALAERLPKDRIQRLPPATFYTFAHTFNGADFWVKGYDYNRFTRDQLAKFLNDYPWIADDIDVSTWSNEELRDVLASAPVRIRSTSQKLSYFYFVNRVPILVVAGLLILNLVAMIAAFVFSGFAERTSVVEAAAVEEVAH